MVGLSGMSEQAFGRTPGAPRTEDRVGALCMEGAWEPKTEISVKELVEEPSGIANVLSNPSARGQSLHAHRAQRHPLDGIHASARVTGAVTDGVLRAWYVEGRDPRA